MRQVWLSIRNAATKAHSFYRAIYSLAHHGDVTLRTYTLRKRECYECEHIIARQRNLYCGKCGCPEWFISDLRTKWRMLDIRCPLNKW
jgi:hypothetical protein